MVRPEKSEIVSIERRLIQDTTTLWRRVVCDSIDYPIQAIKNNIVGRVFVKFKINTAGEMLDLEIARGVYPPLDSEVLKAFSIMPSWLSDERFIYASKYFSQTCKYYGIFALPVEFIIKEIKD
jgi:TonB family protein